VTAEQGLNESFICFTRELTQEFVNEILCSKNNKMPLKLLLLITFSNFNIQQNKKNTANTSAIFFQIWRLVILTSTCSLIQEKEAM